MELIPLAGTTAVVTGASRGFGRAVATALVADGVHVVGVARDPRTLAAAADELGDGFEPVAGDATDPVLVGQLVDAHRPRSIVLAAGASPLVRPLHEQTWESFSRPWEVDVRQAFFWSREALLRPLRPGSAVVAFSSGSALRGSPMSGGYAGANATVRFVLQYAAEESAKADLDVRFASVLPMLTPKTDLGARGMAAYAARSGLDVATFVERMGTLTLPERLARDVVDLLTDEDLDRPAYRVRPEGGLDPLD